MEEVLYQLSPGERKLDLKFEMQKNEEASSEYE